MAKKSKEEVAGKTIETREITVPTWQGIKDLLLPAATTAATTARDVSSGYAKAAGDWAKPRVEHGIAIAGPAVTQAQHAASAAAHALAPRVGEARDRVEHALPTVSDRLAAAIAAGNAARAEVLARGSDAALVLAGDAKVTRTPNNKSGGVISGLLTAAGILAAAGAVAGYLARRSQDREDPWAQPLADPYTTPLGDEVAVVSTEATPLEVANEVSDLSGETTTLTTSDEGVAVETTDEVPPAEGKRP